MIPPSIPENERARSEALYRIGILDTPPEEDFDKILQLALRIFGVSMAGISFIDKNRQWFKARIGNFNQETSREASFAGYTILSDTPFIVDNTAEDMRFWDNPFVKGEPHIRFYAGYPLLSPDGFRLGAISIMDKEVRQMSMHDLAALRELGRMAEDLCTNRERIEYSPIPEIPSTSQVFEKSTQTLAYLENLIKTDPSNTFYVAKLADAFETQANRALSQPTQPEIDNLVMLAEQIGVDTFITQCETWNTRPEQFAVATKQLISQLDALRQKILIPA